MNKPLVSVLIPCYNCERYIADAIESALCQSYKNIEIIVVDDGSTDDSIKVINRYKKYIKYESILHQGACVARNRALEIAQGEYVQFLDADDLLLPEKIEMQLRVFDELNVDWVLCQARPIDENGNEMPLGQAYPSVDGCDPFIYLLNNPIHIHVPLLKRSILKIVGGFRNSLPRWQEFDLHLRIALRIKKVGMVNERLAKVRHHFGDRISSKKGTPGWVLFLLMKIAAETVLENELSQIRASAMASKIHTFSIYAFRNGECSLAKLGFKFANTLSNNYDYSERYWVKK